MQVGSNTELVDTVHKREQVIMQLRQDNDQLHHQLHSLSSNHTDTQHKALLQDRLTKTERALREQE